MADDDGWEAVPAGERRLGVPCEAPTDPKYTWFEMCPTWDEDCHPTGVKPVIVLAPLQPYPGGIAVDGTSVYWTSGGGYCTPDDNTRAWTMSVAAVKRLPLTGGTPVTLARARPHAPGHGSLFLDGAHVYWSSSFSEFGGRIYSVSLGGGAPVVVADGLSDPLNIVGTDQNLYWADGGIGIMARPLDRGAPTGGQTLIADETFIREVATDGSSLYWIAGSLGPKVLTTRLMKWPISRDDARPQTLAANGVFGPVVADGTNVYWVRHDEQENYVWPVQLMKTALDTGNSSVLARGTHGIGGIAISGEFVYFTANWSSRSPPGVVMRVPVKGGKATRLAWGLRDPGYIAVDATSVYFATHESIMKTAK